MQDFSEKKIVLGICGGIAAYKAALLVRELTSLGADVRVIMTDSAQKFITPLSLQALSANEVHTQLFDEQAELGMGHIELARWADYLVIAPASANFIAKMTHGLADDLLSTVYLATNAEVVVCPSMNKYMWAHASTKSNCLILKERGVQFVGPSDGSQACGDIGLGRLSDVATIINALRLHSVHNLLPNIRLVITAGGTQESIDPVRYLANHSSGKMGFALAAAAQVAGATVTLISGPNNLTPPEGVTYIPVVSAQEMRVEVLKHTHHQAVFIGCAAVADYKPTNTQEFKIKKTSDLLELKLQPNADIISEVVALQKASFVVGFAAETDNVIANGREKMQRKKLDMIVINKVGAGLGFASDNNQVTVVTKSGQHDFPLNNKTRTAAEIIAIIAANLQNVAI